MSNIEKNARKRKNKIVVCIVLTVLVIAFVGIDLFLFLSLKDRINNDNTAQKRENTNSDETTDLEDEEEFDHETNSKMDDDMQTGEADDTICLSYSKEQYSQICDDMSDGVRVHPTNEKWLQTMANIVTDSYVLESNDKIVFNELDNSKKLSLAYAALFKQDMGEYRLEPIKNENSYLVYDKESVVTYIKNFFNMDLLSWNDEYGLLEDRGDYVWLMGADGGPWTFAYESEIYENDDFYLLKTCAMEGSNGGTDRCFQYYADILFYKNPDSLFGVTLCYVSTRPFTQMVESVTTSSYLAPDNGKTYEGNNLIDLDWNTAWVEGVDGVGKGETIDLYLKGKQKVHGILVSFGYEASEDLFYKNGIPTALSVDFGNRIVVSEPDNYIDTGFMGQGEYFVAYPLKESGETDHIHVTIIDAVKGSKYEDTCITEIMVY